MNSIQLHEIPHISQVPLDGRAVLLQPWFDRREWYSYLEVLPGEFIRVLPGGMDSGVYYAAAPATPTDLHFPIGTLIAQHLSFPAVASQFYALVEDVHMLCASLEKLELLREVPRDQRGVSFLVHTEMEYLFILLRAMYDVLQKVIRQIARLMCTTDGRPVVQELPDSFAEMVLKGNPSVRRSTTELFEKYGLPTALAECYLAEAEQFDRIRSIRIGIEHHGRTVPSVYVTERGFAVQTKEKGPWSSLEVWQGHDLLPNDLGSVRALAAFLAKSFLETLNRFEKALRCAIHPQLLPSAVFSGNEVYVTNPYVFRLAELSEVLASPWTDAPRKQ